MDYLVSARKWRPQTFEDVIGQEQAVRTLQNAIRYQRIAHAYIFSGPRGVGKTSVARILAKALNCETGPAQTPCNRCTNCREITATISMDVREVDGASNRGIDEIREMRENLKFMPLTSRYKIYIIDEVHMLTQPAFNALLKSLEEPPAHVIFIFATTEMHKIPATILSRCQNYDFRRISIRAIAENLRKIAQEERVQITPRGLTWIAAAGDGSVRDAQSIFDQVVAFAGTDIQDADIEELLGLTDRRFLYELSEAVFTHDAGRCLKIIEDGYYAGLDMKTFYQALLGHFRNLLLAKIAGQDRELLDMADEDLARLHMQTGPVSRETLQGFLDLLMAEEEHVRRSQNPRLNLETILVRMCHLEPMLSVGEVLSRMEDLERRLSAGSTPSPSGNTPVPRKDSSGSPPRNRVPATSFADAGKGDVEAKSNPAVGTQSGEIRQDQDVGQLWESYREFVKKKNRPLGSKIEPGRMIGYENGRLRIGFPKGYVFFEDINEQSQRERIAEMAKDFFHEDVRVTFEIFTPDPESGAAEQVSGDRNISLREKIKKEALKQPLLQKVFDMFEGAEIREVIPREHADQTDGAFYEVVNK